MPSDKAAYLAAHYLSANTKPPSSSSSSKKRKRKRKPATSNTGLLITDDDETGWGPGATRKDDADDDDTPMAIAGTSTDFRRAKKSAWKPLGGGGGPTPNKNDTSAAAEADAIIASAAAESAAAAAAEAADDLLPPTTTTQIPLMSSGAQAGLQSAAALTAQLRVRQQLEREELAQLQAAAATPDTEPQEIILRDATGRRVDASMRRAEARRAAAAAEKAEVAREQLQRGEVQIAQAKERRERLEEAAVMPLARGADDEAMNRELRERERWNDPMAEFLTGPAQESGVAAGAAGKRSKGGGRRPVYKGASAPNRYGIRPGYRWDGVDRGNGFEAERFKAINRRERNKGLEYTWQMDE
jgi:pre-mRNA-splicing factor CWC26